MTASITPQTINWLALPAVVCQSDTQLDATAWEQSVLAALANGTLKRAGDNLYYNCAVAPDWENNLVMVVLKVDPNAVLTGPSVLHGLAAKPKFPASCGWPQGWPPPQWWMACSGW